MSSHDDEDRLGPLPDEHEPPPEAEAEPAERAAALEAEVGELKDRLLRALAEVDNVRRRAEREQDDVRKYAVSKFAGDLLNVADNLRRALDAVPAEHRQDGGFVAQLVGGVEATERELMQAFERAGLKRLDPTGEPFDPHLHEVMFEMEAADKAPGTVMQLYQAGYTIGGRLLRPARVAVAKGGAKPEGVDAQA